jgi:hypothetical protein
MSAIAPRRTCATSSVACRSGLTFASSLAHAAVAGSVTPQLHDASARRQPSSGPVEIEPEHPLRLEARSQASAPTRFAERINIRAFAGVAG